jgi:hypothetical protein
VTSERKKTTNNLNKQSTIGRRKIDEQNAIIITSFSHTLPPFLLPVAFHFPSFRSEKALAS